MMKKISMLIALCVLCCGALRADNINIIPRPASVEELPGTFAFNTATTVAYKGEGAKEAAQMLCEKIRTSKGFAPRKGKALAKGSISFINDKSVKGAEAYTLEVTEEKVVARASTAAGLYYAMQSLVQLFPSAIENRHATMMVGNWLLPCVSIKDEPRFGYRGVMLDPCRHFFPASVIKREIERLAAYKINRLHWHLTDDQGWRIEIKKYPRLTEIGSRRVNEDGTVEEGYYTQEEIRDVVAFAKKHHVEIVPELEIPGHELAAISAYPELSCKQQPTSVRRIWGVEDIVMCPGRELMFGFLNDVIDEMVQLFPGTYYHIGGDESPRTEWAACDSCKQRMKEQGYDKEAQLQSYIIGRVSKHLAEKGKRVIGWDEILEGGNLDTTAVVMSWRGEDGGIAAAKAGHPVLMTSAGHGFYFDYYQSDQVLEPTAFGAYFPIDRVYNYDPIPAALHGTGREHLVMGVQANCWSEYMHTTQILEYRLWPRALALAETAWTAPDRKDYNDFVRRLDGDGTERLALLGYNYHMPLPEQPGGSCNKLAFVDTTSVTLKALRDLKIIYTTDGTNPTLQNGEVYTAPIKLNRTTVLKTATVLPSGIISPVRTINAVKMEYNAPRLSAEAPTKPGLLMKKFDGRFAAPADLEGRTPVFADSLLKDLDGLRSLTELSRNLRDVKNYAAIAEGYIDLPETGIYEFSTLNAALWLDRSLLIDNSSDHYQRHTHENAQIALQKGRHSIKVCFIGGIFDGWPNYWHETKVEYRTPGGEWKKVTPEMLSH